MLFTVSTACEGQRLDKVLHQVLPDVSLRFCRRLVENGLVYYNGQAQLKPQYKVRSGQRIEVLKNILHPETFSVPNHVFILQQEKEYAAVTKPAGIHSAMIAGSLEPCVEAALPLLFPQSETFLLNRLDKATSGFVLVAFEQKYARQFRTLEQSGAVHKEYIALVEGQLTEDVTIRFALDMDSRAKVQVLDTLDPDPARHTTIQCIAFDAQTQRTVLRAIIARGARHQIRAHLAHAGFPVCGDALYGNGSRADQLYLHHRSVSFTGFSATLEPSWI